MPTYHVNEPLCPASAGLFPASIRVSFEGKMQKMHLHFISTTADDAVAVREEMIAANFRTFSMQKGRTHALYLNEVEEPVPQDGQPRVLQFRKR